MNKTQFYFIEDQDYKNEVLENFKNYLYTKNHIVNSLFIGKDIKDKNESLLKLIECNLNECKKESKLYLVCSGPLSLNLISKLNCMSFDGLITLDCSSLSSFNLDNFSYFIKDASKKVKKDNWKSYFTVFPEGVKYIKNYVNAKTKINSKDKEINLYQVFKDKEKYRLNIFKKICKNENFKLVSKGKITDIDSLEKLYNSIIENI